MKQILQDLAKGKTSLITAPSPRVSKGTLLINTRASLVSAGTERMLVDFGKAGLLQKAIQQPERVKMVLEKVSSDGLLTTVEAVRSKLGQPLPLGYCNVGEVAEVGFDSGPFVAGDRVVSNGPHADVVKVSKNLCAKVPNNVSDEEAAFTVVASIGLQGVRLAQPTLGEFFVVTGVGLIGLLTVQLLRAQGCQVLAIDFDEIKLNLAKKMGAETCNPGKGEDPVVMGLAFSRGKGVDGVIVTASTKSNEPIAQAARMSRKRGRIVLVGVAGLNLNRSDFYEKELSFQVSCSYGPGRYDPNYEEKGIDYPLGFVRWTEQRNFEAILDLMSQGKIDVKPLITHRIPFEEAERAYDTLTADRSALGMLLVYNSETSSRHTNEVGLRQEFSFVPTKPIVGVIGAGNYASRVLLPSLKKAGAQFHTIATSGGVSGVIHGSKIGFLKASSSAKSIIESSEMNTVAIVTRHDSHAELVCDALLAGKNVFVEKPLAIKIEDVDRIQSIFYEAQSKNKNIRLMVGFNRRFSPLIKKMQSLLSSVRAPKSFLMTINAGAIPANHWTQDVEVGGGRIIGEACHFIDLMRFLAGSKIVSANVQKMGSSPSVEVTEDKVSITLGFEDGSFGTIMYLANGSSAFPKERIEVFVDGRVLQVDNFLKLRGFGWPGFSKMNLWKQDKGQSSCSKAFLDSISSGTNSPISPEEIFEISRISIQIAESIRRQ